MTATADIATRLHRLALVLAGAIVLAVPAWSQRTYVGADTCAQCHSDEAEWLQGSVHEKAVSPQKGQENVTGCETCHGPGSEHIEDLTPATIFTFSGEPSAERSARCLACHSSINPELNFRRSAHDSRQVGCNECHTANGAEAFHSMRSAASAMAKTEPELCFSCHAEQRADFSLPYHHPVGKGLMKCTSCHTPHGAFAPRQLNTRQTEPVCGKCHEDQQGPFIFEHPAGRASGCQACHQPHGGTNPKMLTRFQVQFLCLECHANTPPSHDLTKSRYQNCTVCHSRIHGSNLNRLYFR